MERAKDYFEALVSVIIPTHNRADIFPRAVKSVLKQTYQNLELIIVDDASSDKTEEIIKNLKDKRIKYIKHNSNKGGAASRNTGIEFAKGEYIAFLDDDDYWIERKIEKQLNFIEKNNFDAICCTTVINNVKKNYSKTFCFNRKEVSLKDLKKGNCLGSTSSLITRAYIFEKIKFDERLKKSQDWDLYITILKKNFKIGFINEPLVVVSDDIYRMRITTNVRNFSLEELVRFTLVYDKHKDIFGWWFYRYHKAKFFLSFFLTKEKKIELILFSVKKTNLIVVLFVLIEKFFSRWKMIIKSQKIL